jgi:hypothetical protein
MVANLCFESNYTIEEVYGLGSEERYYYPNATKSGGKDGLTVKVVPSNGKVWIGVFAFGEMTRNGLLGIYSMPNPNQFCIVSNGTGYIVSSNNPEEWSEVRSIPITDVRCIETHKIIVFADYTELVAYDEFGIKWKTARLAYDSLKIIHIENDVLKGEFWNIRNEDNQIFEVNLNDGSQIGGINEF